MPDMTPQGMADAINDLLEGLPRREKAPSASWQRVLVEPTLNRLIDQNPVVAAAVGVGLQVLLADEPALLGALVEAFAVADYPNVWEDAFPRPGAPGVTDFALQPLSRLVWQAAAKVDLDRSIEAFQTERRNAPDDLGDEDSADAGEA